MIRIGRKPGVHYSPAYNDMSHFFPSHYEYNSYYYVTDEMYVKMLRFTDPSLMSASEADISPYVEKFGNDPKELMKQLQASPLGLRIDAAIKLNPNHSLIWHHSALDSDMINEIRQCVALGQREFYVWSNYDVNIKLPYYKFKAAILNKLNAFKAVKEQEEWDKYVAKVHEKYGDI